jgi:putative effector of murein hydrolase
MFGLTLTVVVYAMSLAIQRRVRWLHPLLVTCAVIMVLLTVTKIPLADYRAGGQMITIFLGPATVALAVPLYKHRAALRRHAIGIAITVCAGCLIGIASAFACAWLLGGSTLAVISVLPKSVTTPISMEVSRALAGSPELTAAITLGSGLVGAVIGIPLLRATRLLKPSAGGLAMGISSHGVGTASILPISELHGTYAALGMALNGLLTATILTPLAPWIHRLLYGV